MCPDGTLMGKKWFPCRRAKIEKKCTGRYHADTLPILAHKPMPLAPDCLCSAGKEMGRNGGMRQDYWSRNRPAEWKLKGDEL